MATDDKAPGRDRASRPLRYAAWRRGEGHPARRIRTVLIGAGLAVYAWIDASAAPFTTRSLVGVLIPGAVLGVIACGWPRQRIPPPERLDIRGISYWLICIAALFEWEASSFRDNSLAWHPSLTNLINPLISPHAVKSAAILLWILAGWELVKR